MDLMVGHPALGQPSTMRQMDLRERPFTPNVLARPSTPRQSQDQHKTLCKLTIPAFHAPALKARGRRRPWFRDRIGKEELSRADPLLQF